MGGMRRAWIVIFAVTMATVVSLAALYPGVAVLPFNLSFINIGLLIRTGGYTIMLSCGFVLAVIALRSQYTYLALLFGLYGVAHLIALVSVIFAIYKVPALYVDWLRSLLTPVVAAQALTYLYIVAEWMRGDARSEADNE